MKGLSKTFKKCFYRVETTEQSGGMPGPGTAAACRICAKEPVGYECNPCGCAILCRRCAMRVATGGKCKQCGKFFISVRRVQAVPPSSDEDSDGELGGAGRAAGSDSSADAEGAAT